MTYIIPLPEPLLCDLDRSYPTCSTSFMLSRVLLCFNQYELNSYYDYKSKWLSQNIFLQNYYATSRYGKTLSRNCSYRVFFYNRLDLTELRHISLQITPNNSTFLQSCFNFLSEKFPNHSNYVLVDGHYRSKMSQMMVRSNIFPDPNSGEIQPIVFFSSPN